MVKAAVLSHSVDRAIRAKDIMKRDTHIIMRPVLAVVTTKQLFFSHVITRQALRMVPMVGGRGRNGMKGRRGNRRKCNVKESVYREGWIN